MTLGKAIAERFGYEHVDVDDTKDRLFGANIPDENLSRADWERMYDLTDADIESYLKSGNSVVDASRNFTRAERERAAKIAASAGAGLITIFVDTPPAVAYQRFLENRSSPTRRDVSDAGFQGILRGMEPPGPDENPLTFRFGDAIDRWIQENISLFG
jgi:predicted kinase